MITDPQLAFTVVATADTIRIGFAGELDVAVEHQVLDAVATAIANNAEQARSIHVDVTAVTFIDSSGLRSLVRSCTHTTDHGLAFTLTTARHGLVPRVLDIAGLTTWFDEHATSEHHTSRSPLNTSVVAR